MCLYAPAELRQSSSTEAKLNGEGRLKAVPGPAASVFNHPSCPHLSLHADQAAVKGAMHPATPIHKRRSYILVATCAFTSPDSDHTIIKKYQVNDNIQPLKHF